MSRTFREGIAAIIVSLFLLTSSVTGVVGAMTGMETSSLTSPPVADWNRSYGGDRLDSAESVVQTSDGGVLFAGTTDSYGAGFNDAWLVKVNPATGEELWNRTYGGSAEDRATAVIETADGGYLLAGYSNSGQKQVFDAWLIKVNPSGVEMWNRTYGGSLDDIATSVIETTDGDFLFSGQTRSFASGVAHAWLVKVNATSGEEEWNSTFGGAGRERADAVIETSAGDYLLAGEATSFARGLTDAWVVKVSSSGTELWNRSYGGAGRERAYSLVETGSRTFVIAGNTGSYGAGSSNAWLVKIDADGTEMWNRSYGGLDTDTARSIIGTNDGGYAFSGATASFGVGLGDAWLVKVNDSGVEEWNETFGGTGSDRSNSVIETAIGAYLFAGEQNSNTAGGFDAWLVKLGDERDEIAVAIVIKPGGDPNAINPGSRGVVPVAILNSSSFEPASVDLNSLRFGSPAEVDAGDGAAPVHAGHFEDVDGDGDLDLVVHFSAADTGFQRGDTEGKLTGSLTDGTAIEGVDSVKIVGR